jgi:hypothetical protein
VGACGGSSGGSGQTSRSQPSPTAPATVVVRSLRLTRRVPARVRAVCAATAKEKPTVPVVCPRLFPASRIARDTNLSGPIVDFQDRAFWVMTFNNGGLDRLVHWIVGAGRAASVTDQLLTDRHNETKGRPRLVRRQRLGGRQLAIYRYPPENVGGGYNSGHVGAFVSCGPLTVFATVHGFGHADAATAMVLDLARQPALRCPTG